MYSNFNFHFTFLLAKKSPKSYRLVVAKTVVKKAKANYFFSSKVINEATRFLQQA